VVSSRQHPDRRTPRGAYWGFRFGVLGVGVSGPACTKVSAAAFQYAPGVDRKALKPVVKKK